MKNIFTYLLIFYALFSFSQTQITDLTSSLIEQSSDPSSFFEFNNNIYFIANTDYYGNEIWVSNGNLNNATLFKDIIKGKESGVTRSSFDPVILGNNFYFFNKDKANNSEELWKSDGTSSGTIQITDFLKVPSQTKLIVFDNNIYFINNGKLWKSDGTKIGTIVIKDNLPSGTLQYIGTVNNYIVFNINGTFWASDGTNTNTNIISKPGEITKTDILLVNRSKNMALKNELFFITQNESNQFEITKTDGTVNNTHVIKTLDAKTTTLKNASIIKIDNKLYFSFVEYDTNNIRNRFFIWESDGTLENTKKIYDYESENYFIPSNIIANGDDLLFTTGNTNGETIFLSLNINTLVETNIKKLTGEAPNFTGGNSYFVCTIRKINKDKALVSLPIKEDSSTQGWIYDFNTYSLDRASYIDNIKDRPFFFSNNGIYNYNNTIYFSRFTSETGYEFWKSEGTKVTTYMLDNINTSKNGISELLKLDKQNKSLFFQHQGTDKVNRLINYNNTDNSLSSINDLNANNVWPVGSMINYNNKLYYGGFQNSTGTELWKTDGVTTSLVGDLNPGIGYSNPSSYTLHKNNLFFVGQSDNNNEFLFRYDGSQISKLINLDLSLINNSYRYSKMISSGNFLFFKPYNHLFRLSDDENSFIKLKEFYYIGEELIDVNEELFFTAESATHQKEIELYKSNGTSETTVLVKNIETGFSSNPTHLIDNNGILYFSAETSTAGKELWRSNGTENGTFMIKDIYSGEKSAITTPNFTNLFGEVFETLNNEVYFAANNGINGIELWKTDGTETGTILLKDINVGSESSSPKHLKRIGNDIYFQAYDTTHGTELWKTNGTEAGTVLVSDVIPGEIGSSPFNIINIDNDIFFIAFTISSGRQIWKLENETSLSIKNLESDDATFIYPNPSHNFISVKTNDEVENIKIYNLSGKLIKSLTNIKDKQIDVSQLVKGFYLIKYEIKGIQFFNKFIKE